MKRLLFFILSIIPFCCYAQSIITIAGTGQGYSGDQIQAVSAGIWNPIGGEFDKQGNYYFADGINSNRILKITSTGILICMAGNGSSGYSGDNVQANATSLSLPQAVRVDSNGNLYICDAGNSRIRKVSGQTGIITTIAGTGQGTYGGDGGMATLAKIWDPQDICLDKYGNLYIADGFNYRVRKVTPSGIITTIAGTGASGYSGENTSGDTSMVGFVCGICCDIAGNVYIASNTTNRLIKINTSGIMTTVAGVGTNYIYAGDNIPATTASISPTKVYVDNGNNIFLADKYNQRVYKITTDGILHSVAGNGIAGDSGDGGPAIDASLWYPVGVSLDTCGNLYIPTVGSGAIGSGKRIRKVLFDTSCGSTPIDTTSYITNLSTTNFSISPNPATTQLTITTSGNINAITILNTLGQIVYENKQPYNNKAVINISALPTGLYLVKLDNGWVQRFLKE
jgi:hypothetical protein